MAVTVMTSAAESGRRSGEDRYVEGDSILAFDGHLAVLKSPASENGAGAGAADSTTLALYAPGTWTTAYVDDARSAAAPTGLGLRP
jgi:hypothetical protein